MEEKKFERKMAIISSIIAALTVIVAAIALIPQFKSAFSEISKDETKKSIHKNMSKKEVEKVIQSVMNKYFDDTKIRIKEFQDGTKSIFITIYVFDDSKLKPEKVILLAEEIHELVSSDDTNIHAVQYDIVSHTSTVQGGQYQFLLPIIVWEVIKTSTVEGATIWISTCSKATTYSNADIFQYEYNNSDIFGYIDMTNFDLEQTHFSDDLRKYILYEIYGESGDDVEKVEY